MTPSLIIPNSTMQMLTTTTATKQTLIFTYGTLKQNHANHNLIQDLILHNDAVYMGPYQTRFPHPLVLGPYSIPYLINLSGSGHRIKGEVYSVTARGLDRLDELEGISIGHYERLPIEVESEQNSTVLVEVEAYFVHRQFAEELWERNGREGLIEYTEEEGKKYVRRECMSKSETLLDVMKAFLSSSNF